MNIPFLDNIQDENLQSISGLDATFLYGETSTSPMHVGSVSIIDGSLKFESFREMIISKIHLIPSLRKRLMFVPFSVDYPYWVDDPNFNIDMHLHHIALPKPGSWKELRAVSSKIFSEHLDRSRPLWSFTFVEGLDNLSQVPSGSVAIISKIHHVAIDGMAGAGMLSLMYDISPKPKDLQEPKPFRPRALPNGLSLIAKSAFEFAKSPLRLPRIIAGTVSATAKAGFLTRVQNLDPPTVPFTAPPTPFNGIISAERKWNTASLDLERIKALKTIMQTTLNDVILAICSGALRRYLLEKGKLPSKPLVAMCPISTRENTGKKSMGNEVSAMLVQLATNVEDPVERLETIYQNTLKGKSYQGAIGAKSLSNLAEVVPFGVANQAAKLYSRYKVAKYHNPVFNLVITNVPGPQMPLYVQGHKLLNVMGTAPILDGMGLMIAVFSYNGLVTISPTSDVKSMPDLDVFARYIRDAANELEAAVLAYKEKKSTTKSNPRKKAASDALFTELKKHIKANPGFIRPGLGLFQFVIEGDSSSEWQLNLNKSPVLINKGRIENPDVTFSISDEHLMKIAKGELDLQTAFLQGRLKINGEMEKAMRLGKILAKLPKLKK